MNPLTWMRENQHRMLVFFTVMLMAGFGALGVMSSSSERRAPSEAQIAHPVVEWKNGTLSDLDLENYWRKRLALQIFVGRLAEAAQKIDPNFSPDEQVLFRGASSADMPVSIRRKDAFEILMWTEKGRELGARISDETIDAKLARLTGNFLSLDEIRAIAIDVGRPAGFMSYVDFRELLKQEFLAIQAASVTVQNAVPEFLNPAAAFQYHGRMERQYEAQVMGLTVRDYLGKVTETPSEAELTALYEEGRYEDPSFDGKRPGFKIGNRFKLEYFVADVDRLVASMAKDLTDVEVRAEYDRLVTEKDPLVYIPPPTLPGVDTSSFPFGLGTDLPSLSPKTDADSELPPLVPPVTGTEATGTEVAEPPKQDDDKKQEDGNNSGDSGDEKQSNEDSETEIGEDANRGAGEAGESGEAGGGEQTFVSLHLQDEESTQEESTQEESTQEETTQEESAGSVAQEGQVESQDGQAGDAVVDATQDAANEGEGQPADAQPPTQEAQIRTFEEVEASIRSRLASPKALEVVKTAFDEIERELRMFRSEYRIHQANPTTEPAPQPIDYQALAKKHGLIFTATPTVDQQTLRKTGLGQIPIQDWIFADVLFAGFDQRKDEPYVSQRISDDVLIWVTEAFPARVGDFAEVRHQVEEYWKLNKARELALADAKSKAAQVGADQTLRDRFPAAKETGAFSWNTIDFMRGGIALSNVRGTERIGEEFMEVATQLEVGKTGVAFNTDRSIVYVVQKTANAGISNDLAVEQFMTSVGSLKSFPFQANLLQRQRQSEVPMTFFQNLLEEFQVKFLE